MTNTLLITTNTPKWHTYVQKCISNHDNHLYTNTPLSTLTPHCTDRQRQKHGIMYSVITTVSYRHRWYYWLSFMYFTSSFILIIFKSQEKCGIWIQNNTKFWKNDLHIFVLDFGCSDQFMGYRCPINISRIYQLLFYCLYSWLESRIYHPILFFFHIADQKNFWFPNVSYRLYWSNVTIKLR